MQKRFSLGEESFVVEASNDGYLLQYFVQCNVPVLGIELAALLQTLSRSQRVKAVARWSGFSVRSRVSTPSHAESLWCWVSDGLKMAAWQMQRKQCLGGDFGSGDPFSAKRQIVQMTLEPGASVAEVARAQGVNANQLFKWRRAFERGELVEPYRLLPVTISSPSEPVQKSVNLWRLVAGTSGACMKDSRVGKTD